MIKSLLLLAVTTIALGSISSKAFADSREAVLEESPSLIDLLASDEALESWEASEWHCNLGHKNPGWRAICPICHAKRWE